MKKASAEKENPKKENPKKDNPKKASNGDAEKRARKFAKYLNEKMEQFAISASALADAVQVNKKSIYRYKNAENPPTRAVQAEIKAYFEKREKELREKEGLRYASEHDLSDEDLALLFYEMDREELDEIFEDSFYEQIMKKVNMVAEGIGYYNTATQKFILNNLAAFSLILPAEMELVERVGRIDKEKYGKVISYLERVPVDMGMMFVDDMEDDRRIAACMKMIRSIDDLPKNKYKPVSVGGKGTVTQELKKRFYEEIEEMYRQAMTLPTDILGRIKTMLEYTREDWYFLFLYERLLRRDTGRNEWGMLRMADPPVGAEGYGREVGNEEYMFFSYLKVLGV